MQRHHFHPMAIGLPFDVSFSLIFCFFLFLPLIFFFFFFFFFLLLSFFLFFFSFLFGAQWDRRQTNSVPLSVPPLVTCCYQRERDVCPEEEGARTNSEKESCYCLRLETIGRQLGGTPEDEAVEA